MPIYTIRGITVKFPFDAYECQIAYMGCVIRSLQEGSNALLESPTGTGKTLCLLCATLAWRDDLASRNGGAIIDKPSTQSSERNLPTIIYTSRTHSQLRQVIQELKASPYRPKMVTLGSREQMCINDKVKNLRGRVQNNACHNLCKKRSCYHHNCVSDYVKKNPDLGTEPFDIEDLVNIGMTNGPCPYYLSRELHKSVDIVFAPYNYLIDPGNRRTLTGIQWENTVLIFDEAHNLESICADAASFDLTSNLLSACIAEAEGCVNISLSRKSIEKFEDKNLDPENFAILKALLLKLEKQIKELPLQSQELGFTQPGSYIYEFLGSLNITYDTSKMLIDTIDHATLLLEDDTNVAEQKKDGVCRLDNLRELLKLIFRDGDRSHSVNYRVHVHESETNGKGAMKGERPRTLGWWCFNPGIAMQEFVKLGIRSIILTSGTLSPLDSLAFELNLAFPVRLENPHVISASQVWVGVVPTGPSGCTFNSSYRNRDSSDYQQDLGNAVVNFARIVPKGLLVFFPSYYLMDKCIEYWQNMSHGTNSITIWERICRHKKPVVEPRQSALFPSAIQDYESKLNDSSSGAVFFAVCRGKVSEGLDFADNAGRAVIVTGIPYAMRSDPKVRLKRDYLDMHAKSQKKETKALTGDDWYDQQAARAVNQAIGRVIRHRHDYGAIVFCDERFSHYNRQCQLPVWVRPHVKCYSKFGDAAFSLTRFFRDMETSEQPKLVLKGDIKPDVTELLNGKLEGAPGDALNDVPFTSELSRLAPYFKPQNVASKTNASLQDERPSTNRGSSFSRQSLSSLLAANRVANKIVPANRSRLHVVKSHEHLRGSSLMHYSSHDMECFDHKESEAVDLSKDTPANEQLRVNRVAVAGSSKKIKLLDANSYNFKKSESAVKINDTNCLKSNSFSMDAFGKSCLDIPACGKESGFCSREESSKYASASAEMTVDSTMNCKTYMHSDGGGHNHVIHGDQKALKASDFLKQVKSKLSSSEYQEFVDFLKALRSKTMKVSLVLDSVAVLFSAPERLFLLKRFKEYVPNPYIPLYEQHLRDRFAAVGKEDEWNL